METAINEITLVLFTTIAPAGVVGFIVMAVAILFAKNDECAARLGRHLVVPLVFAISGLIASATHLGTPANALYVLTGVGRSPLSNEVIAAVLFLALGGIYWIISFRDDLSQAFRRAWLVPTIISGCVFIGFIAAAYSVDTVPTWNLPMAPLTLWLNGLSSGPLIGIFGMVLADVECNYRFVFVLMLVAASALVVNVVVLLAEQAALGGIVTTTTNAIDLVPHFSASIALYAVLGMVALGLCSATLRVDRRQKPTVLKNRNAFFVAGVASSLIACFFVRFTFYATHMTIGI